MRQDAIIGAAVGLTWEELRNYAVSLSRCGFEGRKVLLINDLAQDVVSKLESLSFELVSFPPLPELVGVNCRSSENVGAWTLLGKYRYAPALDFMQAFAQDLRYVLWTDVRDILFQTDPMNWMEDNLEPFDIAIGTEGWRIGDQPSNDAWVKFVASADEYRELQKMDVLCSGCIGGKASAMIELFETLLVHFKKSDPRANDQGVVNRLLRQRPFNQDRVKIACADDGFVATGWPNKKFLDKAYSTDRSPIYDGQTYAVLTPDGDTPFSIVHQYDRDPGWSLCVGYIMQTFER